MFKTAAKGGWNELSVGAELVRLGCPVSFPYGGGCRYDLIVDIRGELLRVQCKTSSMKRAGVYKLHLESSHRCNGKIVTLKYSSDEIDMYATVIEGMVYLIPIKACKSTTVATIYMERKCGELYAGDFLAEKVIGEDNVLDVGESRAMREENEVKAIAQTMAKRQKIEISPNMPSAVELNKMIEELPIWKVAKINHISQRRVWELVEYYGLKIKRGRDIERIRRRGSYESASKKLIEYYENHTVPTTKKIVQYSLDGKEVARYDSAKKAALSTGFKAGQIKRVCLRTRLKYRGFVWRHEGDSFQ